MNATTRNVLFLCTGNSARSIMAESLMRARGRGRFGAFSAGSFPRGEVHPQALALLRRLNLPTDGLRSKSWDEFSAPDAPPIHFVITVCDNAANEVCPVWPGHPITTHWGVPDPASVGGTPAERAAAFAEVFRMLDRRISVFTALPLSSLTRLGQQQLVDEIGASSKQQA